MWHNHVRFKPQELAMVMTVLTEANEDRMFKQLCLYLLQLPRDERRVEIRKKVMLSRVLLAAEAKFFTTDPDMPNRCKKIKHQITILFGMRTI